ncbi:glycosyltransferase family 2 protein [Winogradskyella ouciana]|uniref:glycosyltransferase family 2 protein n=1 Tax=Winogradskyella ouciana TaxID=2608631 RepID=UPI0021D12D04|nr:glycosyltransferase [Winogradskyella ouciana]
MEKFTLIICTYMRPTALLKLLRSVKEQSLYPNEIIIVDGSTNTETKDVIESNSFNNLVYYRVKEEDRGLTKQRNFGINKLAADSSIVCFLDDDIVLTKNYFKELINTYKVKPEAIAVGGYITNEIKWVEYRGESCPKGKYCIDGYQRNEPLKFKVRKILGLLPDTLPGMICSSSHGRSVSFLPPNGRIYEVEQFMGGVSSYKTEVFNKVGFSEYFEGYGLYEDLDFCIRLLPLGKLYVNTAAQLEHYHEASGRPNQFKYGKMVVKNGWYVWRLKNKRPSFKTKIKWYSVSLLQITLRFMNVFNTSKRIEALSDAFGRIYAIIGLMINKPKLPNKRL